MNGDWTEEAKLSAFDPASSDNMGWAVSLSADASVALVGIYGDDTERGLRAGSARAFVRSDDTWTEEVTLLPSNGVENDWFGRPLALAADGTRAIVSSTQHETAAGPNAGSAYVFSIMPGASSGGSNGSGGSSAIDGGAGAPGASDGSGGSGGDRGSTGTTGGAAGESSNDTVHAKTGNDGGCGCRLAPARGRLGSSLLTGLLLAVLGFRRRLRPAASQRLAHKRR